MTHAELRRRSLLAAATVVLALGAGCRVESDTDARGGNAVAGRDDTADSGDTAEVIDTGPDCNDLEGEAWSGCCDDRADWCDDAVAASEDQQARDEAVNECLFGPDYDGSTGCIPWGPAAPPRFRSALA